MIKVINRLGSRVCSKVWSVIREPVLLFVIFMLMVIGMILMFGGIGVVFFLFVYLLMLGITHLHPVTVVALMILTILVITFIKPIFHYVCHLKSNVINLYDKLKRVWKEENKKIQNK